MALPALAAGVNRHVSIAPEATFGTQGAGPGQLLRRVQSDMNLDVTPIQSPEITGTQQLRDFRNGPRRVRGTFGSILSPGSFKDFFDNLLRGTWTAGVTKSGIADSDGSWDAGEGCLTIISAADGAFVASGFKDGDVVRITGGTGAQANLNLINMRVGGAPGATSIFLYPIPPGTPSFTDWSSGAPGTTNLTLSVVGKKLFIPTSGHVRRSFSMEHWFSDISVSHLFTGIRMQQVSLNFSANGMVQMQAGMMGLEQVKSGSRVYASPTATTTSPGLTMVAGKVMYDGRLFAYITNLNLQISANLGADPVIGSPTMPEIFQGQITVRGSMGVFMADDDFTGDFIGEYEPAISVVGTSSGAQNSDFVSILLGRVKLGAPTMADGDMGMVRTYPFQALERFGAGAFDPSTIVIQDSLA